MKRIITVFLFVQLLGSCSTFTNKRGLASLFDIEIDDIKDQQTRIEDFIRLAEQNLAWRAQAISYYQYLEKKEALGDDVLGNKELVDIHKKGTLKYLDLRNNLNKYIDNISWITDEMVEVESNAKVTGTKYDYIITDENRYGDGPDSTEKIKIVTINPDSDTGKYLINEIKLGFAAATILTDNFIKALAPYQHNAKLRKIINSDNIDYKDGLKKIVKNFYEKNNFYAMVKAKAIYDHILKDGPIVKAKPYSMIKIPPSSGYSEYIKRLIETSYTYENLETVSYKYLRKKHREEVRRHTADKFSSITDAFTHKVSKKFGNTVGKFQSRNGKLISKDDGSGKFKIAKTNNEIQIIIDDVYKNIKPLDILLEKTPFRLTDNFIPGHWGHVAIWTGTSKELKELGVWDQLPDLYKHAKDRYEYLGQSFQKAVESGHMIIEALRPGVQINTLRHFLDIDDLGIIRHKALTKDEKMRFLLHAFEQIGKEYDFNFDVESDKRIVCSELAYVVFNEINDWPTEKVLGKDTISPDNIAIKAKSNSDIFKPILIYHDGKRIKRDIRKNYSRLLELKYKKVTY